MEQYKINIILQIVIGLITIGGGIFGLIKLPKKNKLIGLIVMLVGLVASILLWVI